MEGLEAYQQDLAIRRDLSLQVAEIQYDDLLKFYLSPEEFQEHMDEKAKEAGLNEDDDVGNNDEG